MFYGSVPMSQIAASRKLSLRPADYLGEVERAETEREAALLQLRRAHARLLRAENRLIAARQQRAQFSLSAGVRGEAHQAAAQEP